MFANSAYRVLVCIPLNSLWRTRQRNNKYRVSPYKFASLIFLLKIHCLLVFILLSTSTFLNSNNCYMSAPVSKYNYSPSINKYCDFCLPIGVYALTFPSSGFKGRHRHWERRLLSQANWMGGTVPAAHLAQVVTRCREKLPNSINRLGCPPGLLKAVYDHEPREDLQCVHPARLPILGSPQRC